MTEVEPLAKESPLLSMPNVVVTAQRRRDAGGVAQGDGLHDAERGAGGGGAGAAVVGAAVRARGAGRGRGAHRPAVRAVA